MPRALSIVVLLFVAITHSINADDFPPIKNSASEAHLLPMPAKEAVEKMKLPAGFRATLFAAEPDVQNPIGMTWDNKGRLWIAENYTYSDRLQRFDLSMRDRVLIFEDKDSDGRADSRKVFLDSVQMLTSVEYGRGGVWLMCPPQLLFVPDANADDVPDGPAQVVLDGFTVAQDNYHNFANGLKWGPDGWLYGRCGHSCPGRLGLPGTPDERRVPIDGGVWRYHPERHIVEALCHGTTNPWGHDWDQHGELFFINTVIGHLWHMMPGAHMKESFGESMNPDVYERLDMVADHYHFDAKGSWSDSRDGKANDLGGGHAHIGACITTNSPWPIEYRNRLFTINMHGRRVNMERLERAGAGYVGKHAPDLVVAADPFFRGIDVSITPDGQMMVIDWSDTGECHESTGVHRTSGRIFKITFEGSATSREPSMLRPRCIQGEGTLPQLWRDYQSGKTTTESLRARLESEDEHERAWAIRLLTDFWPLDTIVGPKADAIYPEDQATYDELLRMARDDRSGLVQLVLASVLQRLPIERRVALASNLVEHAEYASDRDLPLMVWFGLIPVSARQPESLVTVAARSQWPKLNRFIARGLAKRIESSPAAFASLLAAAQKLPVESQHQILLGATDAFRGWRKVNPPATWSEFAQSEGARQHPELVQQLQTLFGDGRALDEIREIIRNGKLDMLTRQQALLTFVDARTSDMRAVCESVLDTRVLNGTALRGLALVDDPAVARLLVSKYKRFQPEDRPAVIETLVSRASFASQLLTAMAQKNPTISASDLSVSHARQIASLGNQDLNKQLIEVWGELRETPAARREWMSAFKAKLTSDRVAQADLVAGKELFVKNCAQCHQLFGVGKKIGPDLTGAQRPNIDYLLENIVDPSAVVAKGYRMTRILTTDGRVINGLVFSRSEKAISIQTPTQVETIPTDEIDKIIETSQSAMPDGLLETLPPEQAIDLIVYLMRAQA